LSGLFARPGDTFIAAGMFKNALGLLSLFRALYFTKRGDLRRAREQLEAAKKQSEYLPSFVDAFDARLLMMQGSHDGARLKLMQSVEMHRHEKGDNARYVSLYCQCALALYARSDEAFTYKTETETLKFSAHLSHFLPFLEHDAMARITKSKNFTIH
jgi:hypothetical protein